MSGGFCRQEYWSVLANTGCHTCLEHYISCCPSRQLPWVPGAARTPVTKAAAPPPHLALTGANPIPPGQLRCPPSLEWLIKARDIPTVRCYLVARSIRYTVRSTDRFNKFCCAKTTVLIKDRISMIHIKFITSVTHGEEVARNEKGW